MDTKLGTLKNVNLREAWSHEAQDFTPWLTPQSLYFFGGFLVLTEF